MVRFCTTISKESIDEVEDVVSLRKEPLKATTQQAMADECLSKPPTSIDNSDPQSKHSYI
ncbi:hypothetical protein GQ55_1G073100 [Panicum hallii var. hallii]|uniref:Uncharacterized protein n=1 Tax=Panicum hallii var. hallii TaxID=1504633 RepID=A0A2T7F390_9POAL|nr:hypothetical protein GQ55_1G073100 [Panicum hallii var. hallii]